MRRFFFAFESVEKIENLNIFLFNLNGRCPLRVKCGGKNRSAYAHFWIIDS
jgi:hypothetical protein